MSKASSQLKSDIASATQDAIKVITQAAQDASKLIASSAGDARATLSSNAAEAAKTLSVTSSGDHDALNTLIGSVADFKNSVSEKFADLKADIRLLGDGTAARLTECEKGERENSDAIIRINTQMKVWVGALGVFFTILNIALRIFYK